MACAVPICNGISQEWALVKRHVSEDLFGVQLCANNPQLLTFACQLLKENAEVDFIDLNLGCPIELIYGQVMDHCVKFVPSISNGFISGWR